MGTSVPVHGECSDHLHTVTMLPLTLLLVLPCLLLLPHTQGELCTQQVEELMLQMKEMKVEMEAMKQEMTAVEKSPNTAVSQVRDVPYVMSCAYQDYWDRDETTITYSSLLSDYNNHDKPDGGDGVMDISSGQFTCLTAGYYTVTFSGHAAVEPDEVVNIFINHNGERVYESRWWSYSSTANGGLIVDQGSKTVILHLAVGDTLELATTTCDGIIYDLIYCISLTGYDY